jgi:CHRD domain
MRQTFDRRSVLGLAVGSAAGAVLVSSAKPTYAAGTAYKAALSGTTEVPPTTSTGKGTATVTYDAGTKMVTWQGDFSGLSGPATAAHIHGPAEAGKNAGVIVPLSQKDVPFTSPFTGSATLPDDKAAALEAALSGGMAYVNIHTAANPGGEVRGQLAKG